MNKDMENLASAVGAMLLILFWVLSAALAVLGLVLIVSLLLKGIPWVWGL